PVTEKRFAAPRWVFIFGIYASSFRRKNHRHGLPFQPACTFDLADVRQGARDPLEHGLTQLGVRDLPPPEHHGDLDLVLLFEKAPRVPRLRVEVVVVDPRAVLDLLELDHVLLFLGHARLLGHFELVLAVVHDADHGWSRGGRDFDQIQSLILRHAEGGIHFEDAELRPIGADHTDRADANLAVDANPLGGVLNRPRFLEGRKQKRGSQRNPRDGRPGRTTGGWTATNGLL